MFQQFTPPKVTNLARIKIFSIKDLWLFFIGIIFISVTSGSIGAFMLGVSAEEFFLGESEDVVVVTQPGITTPFTGQVPMSLQSDILQIPGVLAISPETLGLSVAQNFADKAIVVRGVTNNFTSLVSTQVVAGSWFNSLFGSSNTTVINGAMAGYLLAATLGLSVGDTLLLVSTLTETVIELTITGILQSNSPCDEELIVSLSLGQTMTGKASSYVSFLRVLIDPVIITKELLSGYLTQEFPVPISLTTDDPELLSTLKDIPIIAYTPYGQHVKTQYIETGNTTFFFLRFGTYDFVANPPNGQRSNVVRVFANQFYYTPFKLSVGRFRHDFHVEVLNNHQPVFNVTVTLIDNLCSSCVHSNQTNQSGIAFFPNIPEVDYKLSITYQGLSYQSEISVTESSLLPINLESSFSLHVGNYSDGTNIERGNITIFFPNNTVLFNTSNYASGSTILLDFGYYRVRYSQSNFVRDFFITIDGHVNRTLVLGSDILNIWVREAMDDGILANVSVILPNNTILSQLTDSNGTCVFTLDVDLTYTLSVALLNQTQLLERQIYFSAGSTQIFDFYYTYVLDVHVNNGTFPISSFHGLSGCLIEIQQNNTVIATGMTDSTGDHQFSLPEPGIYNVYVVRDEFSWNGSVEVNTRLTHQNVRLGNVRVVVFTQTVHSTPIGGIGISFSNFTGTHLTTSTNSSGMAEIIVPTGDYYIHYSSRGYYEYSAISLATSQILWVYKTIKTCGNLTLTLENQYFQPLAQTFVVLRNDYYDYEIKLFTDTSGKISLHEIPWGNYSLQVTYDSQIFPKQIIQLASYDLEKTISIDTDRPIIGTVNYDFWQDSSFSVVLSSEFISGVLQSTLVLFTTTLLSLVIIISVLSLLSIASVISHPIVSNERTLITYLHLGATRQQITFSVVSHLGLFGIIASMFGAILGMWGMTFIPQFQHINIGGIILSPRIDFWLLSIIILSNVAVISIKAGQKINELYSHHLPGNHQTY